MNREQKRKAKKMGISTEPTEEQKQEAVRRWEATLKALEGNALQAMYEALSIHKKALDSHQEGQPTPVSMECAAIRFAVNLCINYLKSAEVLETSPKSDSFILLATTSIPNAAADALKRLTDKRIVLLGER